MSEPKNTAPPSPKHPTEIDRSVEPTLSGEPLTGDLAGDDAAAQNDMAGVQEEMAALKTKLAELSDHFLRAKAETENARRRADEEIAKARKFALESFAESLLPVLDSLEAGLSVQDATLEQIREGTEATLRQLKAALARNQVLEVNPARGERFDPHRHQAISVVPADQEANTVVSLMQKGYTIADRVIRPALVTVAAPK
ncbi:MAG: nucleotide exchange factor GrpE [Proteobacteria bacterium]|nr:nucleotide exchange factor GrpE [Pseudomonadota bacterium]